MAQVLSSASHLTQPFDHILASPGTIRVARILINHGGPLALSRLVRDSGMTLPGVIKVMKSLERLGIVQVSGRERVRLFQATPHHPLVEVLQSFFKAEKTYREVVLEAIREAARDLGLVSVWLFGSAARFEDTPESDLDIFVVSLCSSSDDHDRIIDILRERMRSDPRLIGIRPSVTSANITDLRSMVGSKASLWQNLLCDARVLDGKTPECIRLEVARDTS